MLSHDVCTYNVQCTEINVQRALYLFTKPYIFISQAFAVFKTSFARFMSSEVLDGKAEEMKVFSGLQQSRQTRGVIRRQKVVKLVQVFVQCLFLR